MTNKKASQLSSGMDFGHASALRQVSYLGNLGMDLCMCIMLYCTLNNLNTPVTYTHIPNSRVGNKNRGGGGISLTEGQVATYPQIIYLGGRSVTVTNKDQIYGSYLPWDINSAVGQVGGLSTMTRVQGKLE